MTLRVSKEKRRERLRFRSWHRGTREMDLLMGSFADMYLANYSEVQLDHYERILEHGDLDVYDWIMGACDIPFEFDNDVTRQLVNHHFASMGI